MANYLDNLKMNNGRPEFYTEAFIRLIEDHLLELRDPNIGQTQIVSQSEGIMYSGDFYRYCRDELKVTERWLQNVLLRVNRMETNREFGPDWTFIIIPDKGYILQLCNSFLSSNQD